MKSKEVIKKEIEGRKKTLERAEKYGFQELAEQCKEDITKYNQILKDLDELEKLKNLMGTPIQDIMKRLKRLEKQDKILERFMFYSERKKLGEEFLNWAVENKVSKTDLTNIITWCFCFKIKEWLDGR